MYKEEVKELTELLRTEWSDIQLIVKNLNLDISKTYLLGFIESDDDLELGLLCTEKKSLIRFEKCLTGVYTEIVARESVENEFPQVSVLDDIESFEYW